MVAQIEAIFGKQLSVASVFEHPTIEGLAGVLRQQHVQLSGTGLIPLRTTSGKVPFFCIFGNAAALARHMDKDQPVYWFWSKHHDERGHLSRTSSAEEIAAYYLREIRQIQPQGPYLLGGYCVGATLVYEIARQLGNAQQEVALLVLIDPFKADHYGLYDRINYELSSLENRQGDINKFSYLVMERGLPRIKRWLTRRFQGRPPRSASGMSPDTAGQKERLYLHPLAASALGRYALQPSDAPTLFFMPGIMWLQRKKGGYLRPPPFWGRFLRGMLASYYVPGADHEQLLKEPYVLEIARLLNQHLQDCQDAIRRRGTTH
jgi:thioesterase domain-containing protein